VDDGCPRIAATTSNQSRVVARRVVMPCEHDEEFRDDEPTRRALDYLFLSSTNPGAGGTAEGDRSRCSFHCLSLAGSGTRSGLISVGPAPGPVPRGGRGRVEMSTIE